MPGESAALLILIGIIGGICIAGITILLDWTYARYLETGTELSRFLRATADILAAAALACIVLWVCMKTGVSR